MSESHVATHEWQSFELRMRKRRVERCLGRADAALAAGALVEARAAFAEAQALEPDAEPLAALEERLKAAEADAAAGRRRRRIRFGAVAAVMLLVVTGGALAVRRTGVHVNTTAATAAPAAVAAAAEAAPPESAPEPDSLTLEREQVIAEQVVPRLLLLETEETQDLPPSMAPVQRADALLLPDPVVGTASEPAPVRDTPRPAINSFGADPVPALSAMAPPPHEPLPPVPSSRLNSSAPPASPPPAAAAEDDRVRTVLARYESAYSSLDAAAAGAVYPAIDRQALSRAFEGLAAQQVSLGNCDVQVMGAAARAECAGNATWTPKVGGGSRTQTRLWQFDLRRTDEGWEITRATARNRGSN